MSVEYQGERLAHEPSPAPVYETVLEGQATAILDGAECLWVLLLAENWLLTEPVLEKCVWYLTMQLRTAGDFPGPHST